MAGYIGSKASVVSSGAERKKVFNITTTTTSLTGLVYTPTLVHVFHNGVRLVDGTDYTATNGTSITLTVAAENGDQVAVVSYATFQTSDTVSASAGGTFGNSVTMSSGAVVNRQTTDGTIIDLRKDGTTVGSIGTDASGNLQTLSSSGNYRFGDSNTSRWSVDITRMYPLTDNTYDIGLAGNRVKDLYLSGGVYLGGTGAANLLDDYESGTWTPELIGYTGVTYDNQLGWYVKSGDMITVWFSLSIASVGTYSGNTRIGGAPFSAGVSTTNAQGGIMLSSSGYTETRDNQYFAFYNGGASIYIYSKTGGTRNGNQYQAGVLSGQITYKSY